MIGLCEKCKHIGLDAEWPKTHTIARYARCDNCKLYPKEHLILFHADQKDLRRFLDLNPKSELLSLGELNDGRTGDPLYCIQYWEKPLYSPGEWKLKDLYMHGKDEGEVRLAFFLSHQQSRVNIVGIAPVIGWHVENEKEGKLTA